MSSLGAVDDGVVSVTVMADAVVVDDMSLMDGEDEGRSIEPEPDPEPEPDMVSVVALTVDGSDTEIVEGEGVVGKVLGG
jgi:hypothetical protein